MHHKFYWLSEIIWFNEKHPRVCQIYDSSLNGDPWNHEVGLYMLLHFAMFTNCNCEIFKFSKRENERPVLFASFFPKRRKMMIDPISSRESKNKLGITQVDAPLNFQKCAGYF